VSDIAVRVDHVSKSFRMYKERNQTLKAAIMRGRTSVHEDFWALKDVDFEVPAGSTFGLIGSNGSGKSTLLKCLANIYYPNKGSITHYGKIAAMLEVGSGFHSELSGRDNIFLNGSILGMSKKEITRKFDEIIDFSGVESFIDQPVKNYSSGMYVRLGFAIAINVDPDILVVDEVLAVGDAEFQEKCFQKFRDFKAAGKTVILVSHAMASIEAMCDHAAWLNKGELMAVGAADPTIKAYLGSLGGPPA
jgi:ABC-2 type transport system ATP-binding protein